MWKVEYSFSSIEWASHCASLSFLPTRFSLTHLIHLLSTVADRSSHDYTIIVQIYHMICRQEGGRENETALIGPEEELNSNA